MNLPASNPALSPALLKSAFGEPRRIGKPANSSTSGGRFGAYEPCWSELSLPSPENRVCQNGTREYAPLWNGPALLPAFAAQVLGQAIASRESHSARRAAQSYRTRDSHIASAILLDVSI